ncbi:hypothetical protein LZL87_011702 [Fusarium oxysporum]|nr:hypothetical protein LZL87_011702 [Fusarium oxysporum]
MFASIPTPDSLRQVFNRQAYNEAVLGLLTRQRAPFSAVECRGNHSGERQADLIISILETFGIMPKLGYHIGDNATSNDKCLESIARRLKKNLNIDYDPKKRRIRCIDHHQKT